MSGKACQEDFEASDHCINRPVSPDYRMKTHVLLVKLEKIMAVLHGHLAVL